MDSATLRQAEDLRRQQGRELAALDRQQGRAPSLADLRAINDLANEHRLLFQNLELRLPEQRPDDTPNRYRTRLLDRLKQFSPRWRSTDIFAVARADALSPVGTEILADAKRVCDDVTVDSFKHPGQPRRVEVTDASGRRCIEWRGPHAFVDMFMPPVATFACPNALIYAGEPKTGSISIV